MTTKRNKPILWQDGELGDAWFQQPLLEEALRIAREQEARRRRAQSSAPPPAKPRPQLETNPDLDDWFD